MGGRPVAVIGLLVGCGAAPINAWQVGTRLVLANGVPEDLCTTNWTCSTRRTDECHRSTRSVLFPVRRSLRSRSSTGRSGWRCRDYAERHGWQITAPFEDRALSGASVDSRPGCRALMAAC